MTSPDNPIDWSQPTEPPADWRPPTEAEVQQTLRAHREHERQQREAAKKLAQQPAAPLEDAAGAQAGPVMQRPHPATALVKGWMGLVGLLAITADDWAGDAFREGLSAGTTGLLILVGIISLYLVGTLVFGFLQWRATRFVIDDHELRIEHNLVWHNSDRIPFTKIQSVDVVQPLAARVFGLARLHVDAGSGSGKSIDFVTRQQAHRMRTYLLARAHGHQITVADAEASSTETGLFTDVAADEQVLLSVPPQRLVIAGVLSMTLFWTSVAFGVTGLVSLWLGGRKGLFAVVPAVMAIGGVIGNEVIKQWNFTLVRSGESLKITRGLTTLVSQSVPTGRIMGLTVSQHLPWRPLKLYRVKMDVMGSGVGEDDDTDEEMLLPVGAWADVARAVDAVWPGFRIDEIELHHSPERAKWLHPFIWRTLAWGVTDDLIVARNGGMIRELSLVHHARVQSVHLEQGPLQRRLGLADVRVDTAKGLTGLRASEVDAEVARDLVLAQMDRCRVARTRPALSEGEDAPSLPDDRLEGAVDQQASPLDA